MVVLDATAARHDFPVAYTNFLIGNMPPNEGGAHTSFSGDLPRDEAYAASNAEREALEAAIAEHIDLRQRIEYEADGGPKVAATQRVVQVDDLDRTRHELLGSWGGAAVKRMSWLPLVALVLSLSSLSGTLVVSFRARSRELGILRSCGMTRFGLARLCVAEGFLLALVAIPIAALVGCGGAWLLLQVASVVGYRLDFAGIKPELAVPWDWLWPGIILTTVVTCIAALWAAWRVGRIPTAALLSNRTQFG